MIFSRHPWTAARQFFLLRPQPTGVSQIYDFLRSERSEGPERRSERLESVNSRQTRISRRSIRLLPETVYRVSHRTSVSVFLLLTDTGLVRRCANDRTGLLVSWVSLFVRCLKRWRVPGRGLPAATRSGVRTHTSWRPRITFSANPVFIARCPSPTLPRGGVLCSCDSRDTDFSIIYVPASSQSRFWPGGPFENVLSSTAKWRQAAREGAGEGPDEMRRPRHGQLGAACSFRAAEEVPVRVRTFSMTSSHSRRRDWRRHALGWSSWRCSRGVHLQECTPRS